MFKSKFKIWAVFAAALITFHGIAGVDRGGVKFGVVESNPHVTVDETEVDIPVTAFIENGTQSTPEALKDGRLVTLELLPEGPHDYLVTYDDNLRGPIDWIDYSADSGIFTALGQKVFLTPETKFDTSVQPQSISGLSLGTYVEVSGYRDSSGDIYASYIGDAANSEFLEVTGIAENIDADEKTMTIGDLIVNYNAAELDSFDLGQPVDGNLVEARGLTLIDGEELNAVVLIKHPIIDGEPGTQLLLLGRVSRLDTSVGTMRIDGTPAYYDNDTDFDNGNSGDLIDGGWLFIDGQFDDNRMLHLDSVEFVSGYSN